MIDLDRIHKVKEGKLNGRGCGKTTARIYDLIQKVLSVKNENIVCFISYKRDVVYLKPMINNMFKEFNLSLKWESPHRFKSNSNNILLCKYDDEELWGMVYYSIPMGHDD